MNAGESIKHASDSSKKMTDRVVDAVGEKISDVTDAIADAVREAADKIQGAAGADPQKK